MSMKMSLKSSLNKNKNAKLNPTDITAQNVEMPASMGLPDGGSDISEHEDLQGRAKPNQHPITAIVGLRDELDDLWSYMDTRGSSAYEIAVLNGFDGSETEWLESLKGDTGQSGEDSILLTIESSKGNMFKNNTGSTLLTVSIFKGDLEINNRAQMINAFGDTARLEWHIQQKNEDHFHVIDNSDSRITNDGFSFYLTPNDVDNKATFKCQLII